VKSARFAFKFLLTAGVVALGVGAWAWVAAQSLRGATVYAKVGNPALIVPLANGRLLATDFGGLDRSGAQVLITDYRRRLIWRYNGYLDIPHSAYPMPNGDILIADTGDNRVIEVNRANHIVWDTDDLGKGRGALGQGTLSDGSKLDYPNDAEPLPNGDILISCRLQNRVVEITKQGRIVRSISGFLHGQHGPDLLPDGYAYIADSDADRVIEVNPQNHIVWQFGGRKNGSDILWWPRAAVPLPSGNVLITDSDHDRVIEVTHSKRIVRQWTNLPTPYAASPLSNGNILVGDGGDGFVELNQQDRVVWQLNGPSGAQDNSMPWQVPNGSFEDTVPGSSWILTNWARDDALAYSLSPGQRVSMTRDCHAAHTGHCSGRITYHGDSNGIYFGQDVRLLPGHRYRFSGWIQVKNVVTCYPCTYGSQGTHGHTAEFELYYGSASGIVPAGPVLPEHSGTSGWRQDSVEFTVPPNVNSISIQCELRGQGSAWFDDVWLQKLS